MIAMLRKLAMVIHFFVWSVCYAKPKEVSRREDCVCVRGGPVHSSMPMYACAAGRRGQHCGEGSEGGGGGMWEHARV